MTAGSITTRLIKFGLTGLGVTATHIVIAAGLVELSISGPAVANGIAFVIAACLSFIANARFTFETRPDHGTFFRFLFVTGACGGLSAGIAGIAESNGFSYWIGIAGVVAVVPLVSFLLHNFWSFKRS